MDTETEPKQVAAEDAAMDTEAGAGEGRSAAAVAGLLRGFLAVQQRRAEAYSTLRRYCCRAPVRLCHSGSQPNPNDISTTNFWCCAETYRMCSAVGTGLGLYYMFFSSFDQLCMVCYALTSTGASS